MQHTADQIEVLAATCAHQLGEQGYAVLEGFLTEDQLEELRLEADTLYELAEEQQQRGASAAAAFGGSTWGQEAVASCIYESIPGPCCTPELRTGYEAYQARRGRWPLRPAVWRILFQSQLSRVVCALLGHAAHLFNDQYILKPPGTSLAAFQWHRDSDWCQTEDVCYRPYLSVWCALDDMSASNGGLVVQPGSHLAAAPGPQGATDSMAAAAAAVAEEQQAGRQEQRQQRGVPLEVAAGTAVVMSDVVLHCSGPNRSRHMRRAWMPQFAAGPLTWHADGSCVSLAIPLLGAAGARPCNDR